MKGMRQFHSNAVWPPLSLLVVFGVLYGIVDFGVWLIARMIPAPDEISSMPEVVNVRTIILAFTAGCVGVYRLWRFHPALNTGYATWLRLSPWTSDKPLPFGPVHLVWQDAVVIGLIAAFARWNAGVNPAIPLTAFGLVYFGGMTVLLGITRTRVHCLILGFMWPAILLPVMKGWLIVALLVAIVIVVLHGHATSLHRFPWNRMVNVIRSQRAGSVWQTEIHIRGLGEEAVGGTSPKVGWPFQALSPNIEKLQATSVANSTSLAISLLIGWWVYCFIVRLEADPMPVGILFFAVVAALIRLLVYRSSVVPSFNVWGRIVSGRLIVPRFDHVLLTPFAVIIAAIAGAAIIRHAGSWHMVAEAGVIAIVTFILLRGGPTLQKWILTGQHRYRPPRPSANRPSLQQV